MSSSSVSNVVNAVIQRVSQSDKTINWNSVYQDLSTAALDDGMIDEGEKESIERLNAILKNRAPACMTSSLHRLMDFQDLVADKSDFQSQVCAPGTEAKEAKAPARIEALVKEFLTDKRLLDYLGHWAYGLENVTKENYDRSRIRVEISIPDVSENNDGRVTYPPLKPPQFPNNGRNLVVAYIYFFGSEGVLEKRAYVVLAIEEGSVKLINMLYTDESKLLLNPDLYEPQEDCPKYSYVWDKIEKRCHLFAGQRYEIAL